MKVIRGVTLIELLVAMAIIAIVTTMAMTTWRHFMMRNAIEAETNQLLSTLNFARNSAVLYHAKITICPSQTGQHCGKDWSKGLMVFIDHKKKLHSIQFKNNQIDIVWHGFGEDQRIQFMPFGFSRATNGKFELTAKNSKLKKVIYLSKTGRARVS